MAGVYAQLPRQGNSKLWIALSLPELPLDLMRRRWPAALFDRMPMAAVKDRRTGRANECARQAGIEAGMPEGGARARCAEAVLAARDVAVERVAVSETAMWALHFT